MHCTDCDPDGVATHYWSLILESQHHPQPGHDNRDSERKRRQTGIIGNRQTRLECELGDEMSGPDADTKDAGRGGHQSEAALTGGFPRWDKEIYGCEATKNANASCKYHEPKVMLLPDAAIKNLEHSSIRAANA
jgi:hypothetical protein